MPRKSPLSWFYELDLRVQVHLLAHPHGVLPDAAVAAIPKRSRTAYRDETPRSRPQWQLRSAEAILVEEERIRLGQWWKRLTAAARSALLKHPADEVPANLAEAVFDLYPNGVPEGTDRQSSFTLPGGAAAYIEMVATDSDRRRGGT